jgi:outer membrane protein assembly factor BamB
MTHSIARPVRRLGLVSAVATVVALLGLATPHTRGGDWPQWRGANRDAKVTDFKPPKTWPKELKKEWKVTVGEGVATPALVGDKLFVFSREGGAEITRCLEAGNGKEVWKDKYDAEYKGKGDTGFQGPRASPTVTDGKVITFGLNGMLSCLSADKGEKIWRVETGAFPTFHTSSSPLVVDKFVVVQVGSENNGGVTAYDLGTGDIKWKWTDEGASYASPVLMTVGTMKMIVVETNKSVLGIGLADGKTKWKTPFPLMGKGPGGGYNASTPMIDGATVIFSGSNRGTRAIKIEKKGDEFTVKELWTNKENSAMYNTPVLRDGHVFGLATNDTLFCINAADGKTAWTHELVGAGGRLRGYGSVVDAGSVLMALNPGSKLTVYEASAKEYKDVATYKVADAEVFAYPIVTGNRIYVKDKTSLTLWTVE